MGREIRRVPPDWEHPRDENGYFIPLFDKDYKTAGEDWLKELDEFRAGTHIKQECIERICGLFWEWNAPPDKETCRERYWTEEEATAFQVYEDVSEGTPVTPVFMSKREIVGYLIEHGTYWDQRDVSEGRRQHAGWGRKAAEQFVDSEWAPSMMVMCNREERTIYTPGDAFPE